MTTTTPPTGVDGRDEPEEEVPGVVDYLLYQLYMAEPREFVKCVGSEADRCVVLCQVFGCGCVRSTWRLSLSGISAHIPPPTT